MNENSKQVQHLRMPELHFETVPWHRHRTLKLSAFDVTLRKKWVDALSRGVFLHQVESEPTRIFGKRGFVAVLCRNRASQKRKPQSFAKTLQDINPNAFNFVKVKGEEVLFHIRTSSLIDVAEIGADGLMNDLASAAYSSKGRNAVNEGHLCETTVIINNSPYEFGHSLLVPDRQSLLIQSITPDALKMGIEILLSSSHPGFRVMYNSLCAGASVNHLHLHCYYTEYWLPSEAFRMKPLISLGKTSTVLLDCYELDVSDSCVHGFGFVITEENYASKLPNILYKIVQYFNSKNVAHNIVIIRGLPPDKKYVNKDLRHMSCENGSLRQSTNSDYKSQIAGNPNIPVLDDVPLYYCGETAEDEQLAHSPLVGRVYLFPRQPLIGEKCYRKFLVNVTELFSHLYFGDFDVFNSMSEDDIVKALCSVSLPGEEFGKLKRDVIDVILSSKML